MTLAKLVHVRRKRVEPSDLYEAVVALRKLGHTVYRAGEHCHFVDGERRTGEWLVARLREIADEQARRRQREAAQESEGAARYSNRPALSRSAMKQASLF